MTVEERIERGAALLDEIRPGWRSQVNPDGLRMRSAEFCVLGQLYGNFYDAADDIFDGRYLSGAIEHGLHARMESDPGSPEFWNEREWAELEVLWKQELAR